MNWASLKFKTFVLEEASLRKSEGNPQNGIKYLQIMYLVRASQVVPLPRIHLPMQEVQKTRVPSLGREDPLEEEMATHSSILAFRIPWTEEPDRLQTMGSQKIGHDWATGHTVQFSSVAQPCLALRPHGLQHARLPWPSPTPRVYSNSCPLSLWCHPIIPSSVICFSHPQSFPASGSFQMSQFFTSGGQSIGVSASTSVLSMNIQDWFPLGWTGWISLLSKILSRVFSNTTVQKHQFFGALPSL